MLSQFIQIYQLSVMWYMSEKKILNFDKNVMIIMDEKGYIFRNVTCTYDILSLQDLTLLLL